MDRRDFSRILFSSALLPVLGSPRPIAAQAASLQARRWSFQATVAECCSCAIPCPCNFGRPTERPCEGNRLIQFTRGDHEGADLTGAAFLVTFLMGRWTRLYIDEAMPANQAAALDALLPVAFTGFHRLAQVVERVPLTIERAPDTMRFSAPESSVEMKMVPGLDGNPIVINGLPSNAFFDYVQYESVNHAHRSSAAEWAHSGTNGFISEMRASG